jgi:proteic killer suppression protein
VIRSFRDRASEHLFNSVDRLEDLRIPPGNRLERLSGTRQGEHSIRINEQYRICFRWIDAGAADVEVTDYHDE